jgi:hypothetical protein
MSIKILCEHYASSSEVTSWAVMGHHQRMLQVVRTKKSRPCKTGEHHLLASSRAAAHQQQRVYQTGCHSQNEHKLVHGKDQPVVGTQTQNRRGAKADEIPLNTLDLMERITDLVRPPPAAQLRVSRANPGRSCPHVLPKRPAHDLSAVRTARNYKFVEFRAIKCLVAAGCCSMRELF